MDENQGILPLENTENNSGASSTTPADVAERPMGSGDAGTTAAVTTAGSADDQVPSLPEDLATLDALELKMFAFNYAEREIGFNGETCDPPKGARGRAEALATLEGEGHALLCSDETGALLGRLSSHRADLDGSYDARVRVLSRDRREAVCIPADEQAAFARLTSQAGNVWHQAKLVSDWDSFAPFLDRIVAAMRHMAASIDPSRDPYDVWLDQFERGTSRAFYDSFFSTLRECVVPLVSAISEKGWQPDDSFVHGRFDHARQMALSRDLMALEGIDLDAIVLAETEHPFTDALSSQHAFIATHVYDDDLLSNVYSMLHEGGHALYEQGVNPAYDYTCLRGGTSMGIHESQSRFFENTIGRSQAFMKPLAALLRKHFPGSFGGVTPHQLYLAVNRSEPSLVRTEADELTYPLHIMVRYEIEQRLFAGEVAAAGVPALWNELYRSYLGVEVPDNRHGALQDTHWAHGQIGYFPTYALGSAYDAMYASAMQADGIDLAAVAASGDLAPVRRWLGTRIWTHGRALDAPQLIERSCRTSFDPEPYATYLTEKYSGIYGV